MAPNTVPGASVVALVLIIAWWFVFGATPFLSEAGPFEIWSACVHLGAAILAIRWQTPFFVPVTFWLLFDRETPFDFPVLTEQVFGAEFYASASPLEALVGVAFAAIVLAALGAMALRGLPALWVGLRSASRWARLTGAALVVLVLSQTVEDLRAFGATDLAVEESLETLFAFLLIAALVAWRDLSREEPAPARAQANIGLRLLPPRGP